MPPLIFSQYRPYSAAPPPTPPVEEDETGYGYFVSGRTTGSVRRRDIDELNYETQSLSNLIETLVGDRWMAGSMYSDTKAYIAGGRVTATSRSSRVESFELGTYTVATVGSLVVSKEQNTGCASSATHGYIGGGYTSTGLNTIEEYDFSTETTNGNITATLVDSGSAYYNAGVETETHGYFAGGETATWATVQKLDFTTKVRTTIGVWDDIGFVRYWAATSSPSVGYFAGGLRSSLAIGNVYRLAFNTESRTELSSSISPSIRLTAAYSNTSGYFVGGSDNIVSVYYNIIQTIDFSTESTGVSSATLTVPRADHVGFQSPT
jgi:hypothetical protein